MTAETIPDTLTPLTVNIDDVHPYDGNPREGDVGAISISLETNGQYRPIVVNQRDGRILAGNHTWKAAKALGWQQIAATFVDVDDETARRIVLVDNRSNDVASYDEYALVELLQAVVADRGVAGLVGTGFDGDDLDELLADMTADPLDMADAFGAVPDGERPNATQMTFTLTLEQGEQVRQAIDDVKASRVIGDIDNDNANGNALAYLCREWTAAAGGS